MKMHGPVEIEVKVCITDGERYGVVTIGMGMAKYPTQKELVDRVEKFIDEELDDQAPGFRAVTKREYWDYICHEKALGQRLAMPGGANWDEV